MVSSRGPLYPKSAGQAKSRAASRSQTPRAVQLRPSILVIRYFIAIDDMSSNTYGSRYCPKGWEIIELAIQPDHIHMFVRVWPSVSAADVVKAIKGVTSHELREKYP